MRTRTRRDPDAEPITDPDAARESALKLLERTRRTRSDLARRLGEKGFATATVEEVLERLERVGLVDDTEYARAYLAGRWGRRPTGWTRLRQELRGRGVADESIDAARAILEQREGGVADEVTTARRVIVQAQRRYASLEPRVRQQRLYALLARRGFDGDTIRRALAIRDDEE
jgi:regulatory protein